MSLGLFSPHFQLIIKRNLILLHVFVLIPINITCFYAEKSTFHREKMPACHIISSRDCREADSREVSRKNLAS